MCHLKFGSLSADLLHVSLDNAWAPRGLHVDSITLRVHSPVPAVGEPVVPTPLRWPHSFHHTLSCVPHYSAPPAVSGAAKASALEACAVRLGTPCRDRFAQASNVARRVAEVMSQGRPYASVTHSVASVWRACSISPPRESSTTLFGMLNSSSRCPELSTRLEVRHFARYPPACLNTLLDCPKWALPPTQYSQSGQQRAQTSEGELHRSLQFLF